MQLRLIVRGSAQWPEFATDHGFRHHKGVAAQHIDVLMDGRESLLWIRVNWHVGLFWKANPFPTSPEPLTFTLQRFTDSLTPIRRTFRWPCIHEHRSVIP